MPLLALLLVVHSSAAEVSGEPIARPKDGKTFDGALSTRLPAQITTLPRFGRIHWTTTELPWVGAGPDEGISGVGLVQLGGQLYVVGGFIPGGDQSQDLNSRRSSRWCWRYDPTTQSWDSMAEAPIRREYVRAIATERALYMVGGACQYQKQTPPYRVHGESARFLPGEDGDASWTMMPSLNVARTHMSVGYAGGQLIVAGGNAYDAAEKGYSHKTIQGVTESFDPSDPDATWQMRAPIPGAPRGWSASTVNQEHLYLFGGITWRDDNAIVATQETLRYDPKGDQWTQRMAPPLAISGWEGASYGDRYAILLGGVVRPDPDSTAPMIWSDMAFAYDVAEDRWMNVDGVLPPGAVFNDPGVVILGDTIVVIGAEGPDGSHYNYFLVGKIEVAVPDIPVE